MLSIILSTAAAIAAAITKVSVSITALTIAVKGILSIARDLGIIKPKMEPEELGNRALQAEELGIDPNKFGSYEAYARKIQSDDWGFDPDKTVSREESLKKAAEVGSAIAVERFGSGISNFLTLAGNAPWFFTSDRMSALTEAFSKDGSMIEKVTRYLANDNGMKYEDKMAARGVLTDAERREHPDRSDVDINNAVTAQKNINKT